MKYLQQLWREMKAQPLIGAVTVGGTALAIFFLMVCIMGDLVTTVPVAPVSGRPLFLHGKYLCTQDAGGGSCMSGHASYRFYKTTFGNVPHTKAYAIYGEVGQREFSAGDVAPQAFPSRDVTEGYWDVFNFRFLAGRPFNAQEVEANLPVVVVAEKVAQALFGDPTKAVGQEIMVDRFTTMKIVGVVDNVSLIAEPAYAGVWMPIGTHGIDRTEYEGVLGSVMATVLVDEPANFDAVRSEIARRYQAQNTLVKQFNEEYEIADFGYPFTTAENACEVSSNCPPELAEHQRSTLLLCGLILLVPAINLAGMTSSRLRRRVREFGVRRAFGCTRSRLLMDIMVENFILTLIGGAIGVVLCAVGMRLFGEYLLFAYQGYLGTNPEIPFSMLFHWQTFGVALVSCFVLNIISSGVPAWRASRIAPVAAIGGAVK